MSDKITSIIDIKAIQKEFSTLHKVIDDEKKKLGEITVPVVILSENKALLFGTLIFIAGFVIGHLV